MSSPSIEMFQKNKQNGHKLVMVTCYDFSMAKMIAKSQVDTVLVGDSVAMVQHGFESTVHATLEMMKLHTAAVARGLQNTKFLVADMPFTTFRKGKSFAVDSAAELVRSGAHAVKVEGIKGHEDVIEHLIDSGIPVMGHIGLTPQLALALGGHKVQGKNEQAVEKILSEAKDLQKLGAFSIVLECVPAVLGAQITQELKIPTIGIGAGAGTDGQVLVLNDMLGMSGSFKPKFLRHFASLENEIVSSLNAYCASVIDGEFPSALESYQ